ncbi:MAG TPA: PadR family transcriptional regulator [Methanomassiliicoccaceae archaeon]|nr:PadR family transcriptional regulator [Methanomassiliicoccaceae archaeon]
MPSGHVDHTVREIFSARAFRSGFLKLAILRLVATKPMHGYAIMKEIERLTCSDWRPSPGSIYPTLQELEDNGLLSQHVEGRKHIYEVTSLGADVLAAALEYTREGITTLQKILDYRPE